MEARIEMKLEYFYYKEDLYVVIDKKCIFINNTLHSITSYNKVRPCAGCSLLWECKKVISGYIQLEVSRIKNLCCLTDLENHLYCQFIEVKCSLMLSRYIKFNLPKSGIKYEINEKGY